MGLNGKKYGHTKGASGLIDTDKYEGHTQGPWKHTHIKPNAVVYENFEISFIHTIRGEEIKIADVHLTPDQADGWEFENWKANAQLIADAPLLLEEVKRLRGLLDEIDDVVYYNDKKAGQVLPVEKPNLELLRDIMMSYTDEAYQIRGDEGGWIE